MNLSPEQIRKELLQSSYEWGLLKPWINSREWISYKHKGFYNKVVDYTLGAIANARASSQAKIYRKIESLKVMSFPNDRDEAIKMVLEEELRDQETKTFPDAEDSLGSSLAPFWKGRLKYERHRSFQNVKTEQLDPFKRFTRVDLDARDYFQLMWSDKKGSLAGTVFEALVSHHLVHFMACVNCYCKNKLRWNGGWEATSSWADVICIGCASTYEIKSRGTEEKVEKDLRFNNIRGGSFATYYSGPTEGKRYLILVSRAASFDKDSRKLTHRVTLAEIDEVLPRLCDLSFVGIDDSYRVVSQVSLKTNTIKKSWCRIPKYKGNFKALAGKVYQNTFGRPLEYRPVDHQALPEENTMKENNSTIQKDKDPLDEIRQSLLALKVTGEKINGFDDDEDDWDTLYASD